MGDIKLKKGTGILFVMAVLFISAALSTLWRPEYAPGRNFLWKQLGGPRDSAL